MTADLLDSLRSALTGTRKEDFAGLIATSKDMKRIRQKDRAGGWAK